MKKHFDLIIIGLGAMGSAAAWSAAQRGKKVLGLEQFNLVHDQGSSHGQSRIIREVYYEHPGYVPLVKEAFQRWESLEQSTQQQLLFRTRCANIGMSTSDIIVGTLNAAKAHHLDHEIWDAKQIQLNFPALRVEDDYCAVVENRAGWLAVEKCVDAMLDSARNLGASLHNQEEVIDWNCHKSHVEVRTSKSLYTTDQLIITSGPWASRLLNSLRLPLRIMRQVQLWFTPPTDQEEKFRSPEFPIFILDTPHGSFYGLPSDAGIGVKVAQHYGAPELHSPSDVDRQLLTEDLIPVRRFLRAHLPALAESPLSHHAICIYTLSPDRHFVIDSYPNDSRVALACGFSGHGFKFAPVVGEMLLELLDGKCREETKQLFSIARFNSLPMR